MSGPAPPPEPAVPARLRAWRVSGTYALAAAAWIFGSDWALARVLGVGPTGWWIGLLKGGLFVAVTAALLHRLLLRHFRRAEHAESDLELLARRSPDMIFRYRLGPQRGFEYVSPAVETLTGYSVEEHYASPDLPFQIVHVDDRDRLLARLADPDSIPERDEFRWVRRDGTIAWMEMTASVVYDEAGIPVVMEGILRDVTARRAGARRREILEAAVEATRDTVVITDQRGIIEYVNPAFTEVTGWPAEEVIGKNPRILKSGHQEDAFYQRMWSTLTSGRPFRGRFVNRRRDGTLYTKDATVTPVTGPQGVEHYVAVGRDVTERELLVRQLEEARRLEAIGQVVSGIAHDFRNILGIVRAQVDLARGGGARFPATELEEIGRASDRGADLVRRLLTLGKPGRVEGRPVSLRALIDGLAPAIRGLLPAGAPLRVVLPEDDDPVVALGDPGAVEEVLLNLVTNARDALGEVGTTITVEADRMTEVAVEPGDVVVGSTDPHPGEWARLVVRDDGHGMDPAVLRRVFEPYFTTKSSGTGLGLPMVARLVRMHGGVVTARSAPGSGTTISIYLPAGPATSAAGPLASAPDPEPPRGTGQRVLVVEDEAPLLQAQTRALERLGYRVWAARDGNEAVEILEDRGTEVDLVITDLVMPGRSGKEVYDELGLLGLHRIPVVFMSGYAPTDVAGELPPGGERLFLEKPWTIGDLARKVAGALQAERPA